MTPTEFDFTIKMPGDSRLVSAIRQLTTHAAGYAKLAPDAGEDFAAHVQRATEHAISASNAQTALIEYRFTADTDAMLVAVSCEAASTPHPPSSSAGGVTVEWDSDGVRHVCRIRRQL